MRKLTFPFHLLALASFLAYGCDGSAPTSPLTTEYSPSFSQGGSNPRIYSITGLPMLPGSEECWANDINDVGVVVGGCRIFGSGMPGDEDESHAMVWVDGEYQVLPSLGGYETNAAAVSNRGWIVGMSRTPAGPVHAALWTDFETIVDLGNPGGFRTTGTGLNEKGQVVLTACPTWFDCRGLLWYEGATTDLGDLGGGTTTTQAINELGQIVGYSKTSAGVIRAYVWDSGEMLDLGTPSGNRGRAFGINNLGQVVGQSWDSPSTTFGHAFLWDRGMMTDLSVAGSYVSSARDVSNEGAVVGSIGILGVGGRAYLWLDGAATNLDVWNTTSEAHAINSRGQIVGSAVAPDWSESRAVIWEQ